MENSEFAAISLQENRFWLQIMGDHARFIFYLLAPNETEHIRKAQQFIFTFDQLLEQARRPLQEPEAENLNKSAYENTNSLREFKLQLLALTLEAKLNAHISSTFFNHMTNELEEYLLILGALTSRQGIRFHPLHYHLLWLSDAVEHAASVSSNLDETEKDFIAESRSYEQQFSDLYMKAIEQSGFTRTKLTDFPALGRMNGQAEAVMTPFMGFLLQIRDERLTARLLGTFMPLMADHMAREECYYLLKLSEAAPGVKRPDCDPARGRVEG
jgi:hypothetical protein